MQMEGMELLPTFYRNPLNAYELDITKDIKNLADQFQVNRRYVVPSNDSSALEGKVEKLQKKLEETMTRYQLLLLQELSFTFRRLLNVESEDEFTSGFIHGYLQAKKELRD